LGEAGGPVWLVEEGIGETRSLLIDAKGEVLAAKLAWPGELQAGQVCQAKLVSKRTGSRRGTAELKSGAQALIDHLPPHLTQGASFRCAITRAPIAERGRYKRAQARWFPEDADPSAAPKIMGEPVRRFESGLYEEVWHSASSGSLTFAGGEILCSVTPAMTLIDIDGDLAPRDLALASIPAIEQALRWFDLGGAIGIDFPTLAAKSDRRAVDEALGTALADWPHERTAMNGFGFVQVVARLEGPSLLHRFDRARTGMCARFALRIAEGTDGAGVTLLTVHPALRSKLKPEWLDELRRRTGRDVRLAVDPDLALETPHAQIITR
jgi:hypothetical protein